MILDIIVLSLGGFYLGFKVVGLAGVREMGCVGGRVEVGGGMGKGRWLVGFF